MKYGMVTLQKRLWDRRHYYCYVWKLHLGMVYGRNYQLQLISFTTTAATEVGGLM